jgi:hypothetical protein
MQVAAQCRNSSKGYVRTCWVGLELVHEVIVATRQLGSLHVVQRLQGTENIMYEMLFIINSNQHIKSSACFTVLQLLHGVA